MKASGLNKLLTFAFLGVFSLPSFATDSEANIIREEFNYIPQTELQTVTDAVRCGAGRFDFTTTLNQTGESYQVRAKIYIPDSELKPGQKRPYLFILPTIKGGAGLAGFVDRYTAFSMCFRGFVTVLLENDFTGLASGSPLGITESDLSIRRVVAALKGGIQIAVNQFGADSRKIGLFGASLGGILGVTAYGVMPEITAASFIVAGGDLPHILTYSKQKPIIRLKESTMEKMGLKTNNEYIEYLKTQLRFDPLYFAEFIDRGDIQLLLSLNDKSVPTVDQLKLYNELDQPEDTKFVKRKGHAVTITSALLFGRHKKHMADWFRERFKSEIE